MLKDCENHKIVFQQGVEDIFSVTCSYVGQLNKIQIGHDSEGKVRSVIYSVIINFEVYTTFSWHALFITVNMLYITDDSILFYIPKQKISQTNCWRQEKNYVIWFKVSYLNQEPMCKKLRNCVNVYKYYNSHKWDVLPNLKIALFIVSKTLFTI